MQYCMGKIREVGITVHGTRKIYFAGDDLIPGSRMRVRRPGRREGEGGG
jgi:hypothetical protein